MEMNNSNVMYCPEIIYLSCHYSVGALRFVNYSANWRIYTPTMSVCDR